jgi:hypothetical protein
MTDNESENEPQQPNGEQLRHLSERFDLTVSSIPILKTDIQKHAIGGEANWQRGRDEMEGEEFLAQSGLAPYGEKLDAIMSWLIANERAAVQGGMVPYGAGEYRTAPEDYITADGRYSIRYNVIRLGDGVMVREVHDFEEGSAEEDRQRQIETEHDLGLNAQPLSEDQAGEITSLLEHYHAALADLSLLDEAALIERMDLEY